MNLKALIFFLIVVIILIGFFIPGEGRKMFRGWYTLSVPWAIQRHSIADHVEFGFIDKKARDAYRTLMIAHANALIRLQTNGEGENTKKIQKNITSAIDTMYELTDKINEIDTEDEYKGFIGNAPSIFNLIK